jgi:hypothetical protein
MSNARASVIVVNRDALRAMVRRSQRHRCSGASTLADNLANGVAITAG